MEARNSERGGSSRKRRGKGGFFFGGEKRVFFWVGKMDAIGIRKCLFLGGVQCPWKSLRKSQEKGCRGFASGVASPKKLQDAFFSFCRAMG